MILFILGMFSPAILAINVRADDRYLTGLLASGVYEGDNIITQNDCVIGAGSDVKFVARNSITLNPGFRVESGGLFSAMLDDNDGLPNEWELTYFGTLGFGPNDNPDGDGVSNYLEYRLHTNPASVSDKPIAGYFYEYDGLGRLKNVIYLSEDYSNNYEIQYKYDSSGNRISKIIQIR